MVRRDGLYSAYFLTLAPSAVFAVYTAEEHERGAPKRTTSGPIVKNASSARWPPGTRLTDSSEANIRRYSYRFTYRSLSFIMRRGCIPGRR